MKYCLVCGKETINPKFCSIKCCCKVRKEIHPNIGFQVGHEKYFFSCSDKQKEQIRNKIIDKWKNDIDYIDNHIKGSKKQSQKLRDKYSNNGLIIWNKGKTAENDPRVAEYSLKGSITARENYANGSRLPPMVNKFHTEKTKKIIGIKSKQVWKDLDNYSRKERIRKQLYRREMSSLERRFLEICRENNFPFIFNGYLSNSNPMVIAGKVPDFIYRDKLIEIMGKFYHNKQESDIRRKIFESEGYSCLFIWGCDFNNEEKIINEVRNFGEV